MPLQLARVEDRERGSAGHSAVRGALSGTKASQTVCELTPKPEGTGSDSQSLRANLDDGSQKAQGQRLFPLPSSSDFFLLSISACLSFPLCKSSS